jgi:hypothetical protein
MRSVRDNRAPGQTPHALLDLHQRLVLRPACLLINGAVIRSTSMMDVVMLAIGFVFFALSIVYVYACDQL